MVGKTVNGRVFRSLLGRIMKESKGFICVVGTSNVNGFNLCDAFSSMEKMMTRPYPPSLFTGQHFKKPCKAKIMLKVEFTLKSF